MSKIKHRQKWKDTGSEVKIVIYNYNYDHNSQKLSMLTMMLTQLCVIKNSIVSMFHNSQKYLNVQTVNF